MESKPSSSKSVPPDTMPRAYSSIFALACWISDGKSRLIDFAMSRKSWNGFEAIRREVYAESEPAGTVPPAEGVPVGSETWPLSL